MKTFLKVFLFTLSFFHLEFSATNNINDTKIIKSISVQGLINLNQDIISSIFPNGLKEGHPYSDTLLQDVAHNLTLVPYIENAVALKKESSDGVDVAIVINEKRALTHYFFTGNKKLSSDKLIKELGLKEKVCISEHEVEVCRKKIIQAYAKENYFNVDVRAETEKDMASHQIQVYFEIIEGAATFLERVKIKGCNNIPQRRILKELITKPRSLCVVFDNSGVFAQDRLDNDKHTIERFYANRGYFNAKVYDIEVSRNPEKKSVGITFFVEEGPKYKFRFTNLPQDEFSLDELKKLVPYKAGDTFCYKQVKELTERIKACYGARSYLFCEIVPDFKPVVINGQHFIDVEFMVDKGLKQKINEIKISGNSKTKEYVIRRALAIHEGMDANKIAMDNSLVGVQSLGYFNHNHLDWQINRKDKGLVDLELNLKEAKTREFTGGLNIDTNRSTVSASQQAHQDQPSVSTSRMPNMKFWIMGKARNFGGMGWDGSVAANWEGKKFSRLEVDFMNPYVFNKDYSFGVKAYSNESELNQYSSLLTSASPSISESTKGVIFSVGRCACPSTYGVNILSGFGLEKSVHTKNFSLKPLDARSRFAKRMASDIQDSTMGWFSTKVNHNTTNHPVYPYSGHFLGFDTKMTLPGFTDEYCSMFKAEISAYHYMPLVPKERLVLSSSLRLGLVAPLFENTFIPRKELFMVGGDNCMRGFEYGACGPVDRRSFMPLGATRQFIASFELSTPMSFDREFSPETPRAFLFADLGCGWNTPKMQNIYDPETLAVSGQQVYQSNDLRKDKFSIRQTIGMGLKMTSPQPINISWGYNLDRVRGHREPQSSWHFALNMPFFS